MVYSDRIDYYRRGLFDKIVIFCVEPKKIFQYFRERFSNEEITYIHFGSKYLENFESAVRQIELGEIILKYVTEGEGEGASNGQKGKGHSPFDLIYQNTHQKMKEGKTYQYEVILVKEDKYSEKYNREKMGICSTLSDARTLACKSASQPKTEAMLFRIVVYTDKAGKREIKSYSHIETWRDHNGKPVRVIDE